MALGQTEFTTAYTAFLTTVRTTYPDAVIFSAVGPLLYGTGLTNAKAYMTALVADVNASGDQKVKLLDFGQQNASLGTGCDWHPSAAENQRMATSSSPSSRPICFVVEDWVAVRELAELLRNTAPMPARGYKQ